MKKSDLLIQGSSKGSLTLLLAHGAGAPMDSDWMNTLTDHLVQYGVRVIRFEFPYMADRRQTGTKRPPNTQKVLLETWREVLELVGDSQEVWIGGKSLGGRMASLLADDMKVKGLVCLGFPFHAPGKSGLERAEHLREIKTPTFIVQGTRDALGGFDELDGERWSKSVRFHWLEDGDHSFKPRKSSGYTLDVHLKEAAHRVAVAMKG